MIIAELDSIFVIAAWAITRGILEIVAAIQLRREISNEWLVILSGLLSITFGVLLFVRRLVNYHSERGLVL